METTNNELMGKSFPNVTAAVMEKLEEREEFHRNEKKVSALFCRAMNTSKTIFFHHRSLLGLNKLIKVISTNPLGAILK